MKSNPTRNLKNHVISPKVSHITELIIRHAHKNTQGSGRGFTLNEARSNGYWVTNGNAAVGHFI